MKRLLFIIIVLFSNFTINNPIKKDLFNYKPGLPAIESQIANILINKSINIINSIYIPVKASYYNPVISQCDDSPLYTGSGSYIDTIKLKNKEIRWMALSYDLLVYFGGTIKYGDKLMVISDNPNLKGVWYAKDAMNNIYKHKIDFLCYNKINGNFNNIKILKI